MYFWSIDRVTRKHGHAISSILRRWHSQIICDNERERQPTHQHRCLSPNKCNGHGSIYTTMRWKWKFTNYATRTKEMMKKKNKNKKKKEITAQNKWIRKNYIKVNIENMKKKMSMSPLWRERLMDKIYKCRNLDPKE